MNYVFLVVNTLFQQNTCLLPRSSLYLPRVDCKRKPINIRETKSVFNPKNFFQNLSLSMIYRITFLYLNPCLMNFTFKCSYLCRREYRFVISSVEFMVMFSNELVAQLRQQTRACRVLLCHAHVMADAVRGSGEMVYVWRAVFIHHFT